jgi:hypothetical protein
VTFPSQCSAGLYNPTYYGESDGSTFCITCPAGYYCPAGTTNPIKCPAGFICEASSTEASTDICAAGTYSGAESIGASSDCRTCPTGYYCPSDVSAPSVFPIPCPQGTYRDSTSATQLSDCVNCSSGRVCPYLGNQVGDDISLPCIPGFPCPAGTATFYQYKCPAGTYSDL